MCRPDTGYDVELTIDNGQLTIVVFASQMIPKRYGFFDSGLSPDPQNDMQKNQPSSFNPSS